MPDRPASGRVAHLGLGAFFRAHQAWYTDAAMRVDGGAGIVAFTGRSPESADVLTTQGCRYSLIERSADGDTAQLIGSVAEAVDGADAARWREVLADPAVGVLTLTVTEKGYHATRADGEPRLEAEHPAVARDLELLRSGSPESASTAPGRIVDALRARMTRGGGPLAVVSCDNLAENGRVTRAVVQDLAERVDLRLAEWIAAEVSFVSTMVDRITPAAVASDREVARELTGLDDRAPVVTEPFREWILEGSFPAGRPRWEVAGARFVDDVSRFERRKLWLLNAGHSLLAYRGLALGHATVAEAFADERCRSVLERLWSEASEVLPFDADELDAALGALRERFSNARIEHRLAQIAEDGSKKLPDRILAPLRERADRGLALGSAEVLVLSAWAGHLSGPDRRDAASDRLAAMLPDASPVDAARLVLQQLGPDLVGGEVEHALAEVGSTPLVE